MTLCRRGRSVLVLTLVFGVTVVSAIPMKSRGERIFDGRALSWRGSPPGAAPWSDRRGLRPPRSVYRLPTGPETGGCREFRLDQGLYRAGFVEFRRLNGIVERALGMADPRFRIFGEQPHDLHAGVKVPGAGAVDQVDRLLNVARHQFAFEGELPEHPPLPSSYWTRLRALASSYRTCLSAATARAWDRQGRLRPRSAFPPAGRWRRRDWDGGIL